MKHYQYLGWIALIGFFSLGGCGEESYSFDPANGQTIMAQAVCGEEETTCPGTPLPSVELEDFQPQSPDVGTLVNLQSFQGQPLLVALLASW